MTTGRPGALVSARHPGGGLGSPGVSVGSVLPLYRIYCMGEKRTAVPDAVTMSMPLSVPRVS